jgi:hypothetical protein
VRTLLAHPLAMAYLHRGDVAAAERVMRQAASEGDALYPTQHPSRATIHADLALILLVADRTDEARELALSARDVRRALEDEDASIAQPELVLAVLDCLAQPGASARANVDAALDRIRTDVALSPATLADTVDAAARCKPD